MTRIDYLDGMRGLAILLVVMFHGYVRWSEHLYFGDQFSNIVLFKFGWLGVELFFMISGFVILMSLERCGKFKEFIYKRWLRLFPAMCICSIFIFATCNFFYERPLGQPAIADLLPGLSFIEPYFWNRLFGIEISSLEGAFWSLYVEVKFYLIAGFLYFLIGSKGLFWVITTFSLVFISVDSSLISGYNHNIIEVLHSLLFYSGYSYFLWFSVGMTIYFYSKDINRNWLFLGGLLGVIASLHISNGNLTALIYALILTTIFIASAFTIKFKIILTNRPLMILGYVSYPLYLIHENMLISITNKLSLALPFLPSVSLPILALLPLIAIAYFISKYLERNFKIVLIKGMSVLMALCRRVLTKNI